jgi:hypothetical protein
MAGDALPGAIEIAVLDATGPEFRLNGALRLSLAGEGYGARLRAVPAVSPVASGNTVSYRWGALTEWYRNGPFGLEQGFVVPARPSTGPGPLTLVVYFCLMQQILLEVPQLGFPGVSYLDALDHMHKLNPGTVLTVLLLHIRPRTARKTRSPGSERGWAARAVPPPRSAPPRSA